MIRVFHPDGPKTTYNRRTLEEIGNILSPLLNNAERDRILALHRFILSLPVDIAGNPILSRTKLREETSLHRALGKNRNQGNAAPIISSTSGVLHPRSGLVNRTHKLAEEEVDSRFTAKDLALREAEFLWFAVPGTYNPFQSERNTTNWKAQRAQQTKFEEACGVQHNFTDAEMRWAAGADDAGSEHEST